MATINNSKIQERIASEAKIQLSVDAVPTQLAEKVVPVLVSNPLPEIKIEYDAASNTTSSIIMTTSTKKRTFLRGASIAVSKDASATSTYVRVSIIPKGSSSRSILYLRLETLTAVQGLSTSKDFIFPIELEKGSVISAEASTGTSSLNFSSIILYSEED